MSTRPELRRLATALRGHGMPRRAALRMAEEWLAHRADLEADARARGYSPSEAHRYAEDALGQSRLLLERVAALPGTVSAIADRERAVLLMRWGSASLAGFATTVFLFAGLTRVIGA